MNFSLFEIIIYEGWWVTLFDLGIGNWEGSLVMIGRTNQGEWEFDFLFLRSVFNKIIDNIKIFEGDE